MFQRSFARSFLKIYFFTQLSLLLAVGANSAQVRWDQETIKRVLKDEIKHIEMIARDKVIISAVVRHNDKLLTFDEIMRRDRLWQDEDQLMDLKSALNNSEIGQFVETFKNSKNYYSEVFLADDRGALVAAYPLTSDYWQGDEEKWTTVVQKGWPSYISAMTFDESSQSNIVQISVPVMHETSVVGVLVVGIRLSHILMKQVQTQSDY